MKNIVKSKNVFFMESCFAGIFLVLFFSACGTAGKDFDESLYTKIVKGTTTQEDIRAMFGPPFKKGIQNGLPVWTYEYNHYNSLGTNTHKDMVIVFRQNGVVQSHQLMTNSPQ